MVGVTNENYKRPMLYCAHLSTSFISILFLPEFMWPSSAGPGPNCTSDPKKFGGLLPYNVKRIESQKSQKSDRRALLNSLLDELPRTSLLGV